MPKHAKSSKPDASVDHADTQRQQLEKLAELYEKLDEKLVELEAKVDKSPHLAAKPKKPR